MAKFHIEKDDRVIVLAGTNKGETEKVLRVIADREHAIVEGVNMAPKSTKPSAAGPRDDITKQEAAVHISNLSLINPKSGKATHIKIEREGKTVKRIAKKLGKEIE